MNALSCASGRGRPHSRSRFRRAALLLTVMLLSSLLWARVSARLPGGLQSVFERYGAQELYRAPVSVNGVAGDLVAYGLTLSPRALGHQLDQATGQPGHAPGGAVMRSRDGGREAHYVVIPTAAPDRTVVMRVERAVAPAQGAGRSLAWPTDAIPQYPQSELTFAAHDGANHTTLCVAETHDSSELVRTTLDQQLRALNWLPAPMSAQTGLYARDQEICLVHLEESDQCTRITLLHKQPTPP